MIPFMRRVLSDRFTPGRDGIRTFWWRRMGLITDRPNLGDELTPGLVREIAGLTCTWAHPKRSELIGTGSILEMVQHAGAPNGLKVWGSGFMTSSEQTKGKFDNPDFDFYAVRGKLTLERLNPTRPVVLGDPGLLASRGYPRAQAVPGQVGIVYHYVHKNDRVVRALARDGRFTLIDPSREPGEVISEITKCDFIFSSSLHGLIIADSFGIANAWISLSRPIGGAKYKFEDYYSAFDGRAIQHDARIVWDADAVSQLKKEYRGVPNLNQLQDELIDAFPYP